MNWIRDLLVMVTERKKPKKKWQSTCLIDGKVPVLLFRNHDGLFWFRVFGKGLFVKDTNRISLDFSERQRLVRRLRFKQWIVGWLQ